MLYKINSDKRPWDRHHMLILRFTLSWKPADTLCIKDVLLLIFTCLCALTAALQTLSYVFWMLTFNVLFYSSEPSFAFFRFTRLFHLAHHASNLFVQVYATTGFRFNAIFGISFPNAAHFLALSLLYRVTLVAVLCFEVTLGTLIEEESIFPPYFSEVLSFEAAFWDVTGILELDVLGKGGSLDTLVDFCVPDFSLGANTLLRLNCQWSFLEAAELSTIKFVVVSRCFANSHAPEVCFMPRSIDGMAFFFGVNADSAEAWLFLGFIWPVVNLDRLFNFYNWFLIFLIFTDILFLRFLSDQNYFVLFDFFTEKDHSCLWV